MLSAQHRLHQPEYLSIHPFRLPMLALIAQHQTQIFNGEGVLEAKRDDFCTQVDDSDDACLLRQVPPSGKMEESWEKR